MTAYKNLLFYRICRKYAAFLPVNFNLDGNAALDVYYSKVI